MTDSDGCLLKSIESKSCTKNELIRKIDGGKKLIVVELDPPENTDSLFLMDAAKTLKEHGVDAVTLADCPLAKPRADSSIIACKLKRELDITVIPHMTCRDRNINAARALLLGLSIEGVDNILVVTGDQVPLSQRNDIKTVFAYNSSVFAGIISDLDKARFTRPFTIHAALNINAVNFNNELAYAKKKITNGVSMFLTQPVLSKQASENLRLSRKELDAKILGGILPIVSYKNACFLNRNVPGINISEDIIRLYKDASKEQESKLAAEISLDFAREIEPFVDGYYIITPFKRIDIVTKIMMDLYSQTTKNNIASKRFAV